MNDVIFQQQMVSAGTHFPHAFFLNGELLFDISHSFRIGSIGKLC